MRNGFRVIDSDCHQMEPPGMWQEFIDAPYRDRAPRIGDMGDGRKGMMVEDEPVTNQHGNYPMDSQEFHEAAIRGMQSFARARKTGFDPASGIADMDEQGVDAQVIYPTVGAQILGKPLRDTELLAAVCRGYNDWSLDYCSKAPGRLRMPAMLPLQNVTLAIEEAERTAAKGAAAFYVRPNP